MIAFNENFCETGRDMDGFCIDIAHCFVSNDFFVFFCLFVLSSCMALFFLLLLNLCYAALIVTGPTKSIKIPNNEADSFHLKQ